jgi:tetrahydromethanopterin S-methyltransferase subunit G
MHIDGKIHQGFQVVRVELEKLSRRREEIERQLEFANEQV